MKFDYYANLVSHVYWERKERFALDRDIYPYWTMFAAQEGKFAFSINDHEGEAGFGDLVICPPNTWFHRRTISTLNFHFLHFSWEEEPAANTDTDMDMDMDMEPAAKTDTVRSTESEIGEELQLRGKISIADEVRLLSDLLYLTKLAPERNRIAQANKQHLLNDLLRLVSLERGNDLNPDDTDIPPELQQAHQLMTAHAYAPLNMRNLAHSLKLSPVQLTRRFRTAYGVTPSEFVTELRLSRACRLLEETELSIDKIATRCGYENGFYLSRVFRQKRGMTPSFYRKTHRV
ncbi:helix-turn-helix domain-containing protein [Paenibacillus sp. CF384]|uniref:helix-turn-helix domain-containing protein n=1 Tax=Paenibacillus sp. CF384 TaxID=1884382 RepID=UPI00089C376F|nr:helix-turn-helix domain-containing protein [Paenibacillus sp. CF384]SDW03667.1 Helix-turn-helix domain-containing protein [Paenibacillus sp. CF384]